MCKIANCIRVWQINETLDLLKPTTSSEQPVPAGEASLKPKPSTCHFQKLADPCPNMQQGPFQDFCGGSTQVDLNIERLEALIKSARKLTDWPREYDVESNLLHIIPSPLPPLNKRKATISEM